MAKKKAKAKSTAQTTAVASKKYRNSKKQLYNQDIKVNDIYIDASVYEHKTEISTWYSLELDIWPWTGCLSSTRITLNNINTAELEDMGNMFSTLWLKLRERIKKVGDKGPHNITL